VAAATSPRTARRRSRLATPSSRSTARSASRRRPSRSGRPPVASRPSPPTMAACTPAGERCCLRRVFAPAWWYRPGPSATLSAPAPTGSPVRGGPARRTAQSRPPTDQGITVPFHVELRIASWVPAFRGLVICCTPKVVHVAVCFSPRHMASVVVVMSSRIPSSVVRIPKITHKKGSTSAHFTSSSPGDQRKISCIRKALPTLHSS
jgi:hypothetical protein